MISITKKIWERYFPFKTIRSQQEDAINFALNAYINEGKKAVVLELSTGVGKSATGITIARYMDAHAPVVKDTEGMPLSGAYVLTTQKILQEQYMEDFGQKSGKGLLRTIKSSSNYKCKFYTDQSCSESKKVLSKLGKQLKGTEFEKQCKESCTYTLEKSEFIESPLSITNFSYFLAETTYAGRLTPRAMLVIDECHNTESELSKFVEVSFSEKFARDVLKCKVPKLDSQTAVFEWVSSTYKKSVNKYVKDLEKNMVKLSDATEGYSQFSKQYEMLEKHTAKIDQFVELYREDNWAMNITYPQEGNKRGARKFEFKPVDVSKYSNILFRSGARLLLMSATIVDKDVYCSSIGLDPKDVAYLRIPSPFPVENHPIHFVPVGSMSKDYIDKTLPVMAEAVRMLLEKHPNEKGVIHTANYKVAKYILENLKTGRLLSHDSNNRDEVLRKHYESDEATVLISPSMMEGVDLADDASRFQILCKIPFPYLGDLVIKKRMDKNKQWYPYTTAKSIIQSFGRSIRNEKDYAVSYILDSDWERFYSRNKHMFSEDFNKSFK
jgi:Rad3-related DNA helicase